MNSVLIVRLARYAACCVILLSLSTINSPAELAREFQQPPASARPWVYWFWLNGNITSNGITADLESMKHVGIGGVLIMEVDQGAPKGPAGFAGPQWRELFKHVCAEASRLGIEVNMNNDAGWCGSGGPWITPELSMQRLTWSETNVRGPARFESALAPPQTVADYYRDVAVLAFPMPAGDDLHAATHKPEVTASVTDPKVDLRRLLDGHPRTTVSLPLPQAKKPQYIQLAFKQPFTAQSLSLALSGSERRGCHGSIQVSQDGKKFKTVREFDVLPPSQIIGFNETTARYFRVVFTRADAKLDKLVVGEVDLGRMYRIENIRGKAAFVRQDLPIQSEFPTLPAGVVIARDRMLNLTERMDAAGRLAWEVPAGQWTILRLGHTSTGKDNHPSPAEGRGLECDKLSREAAEAHFNGLMAKLIRDVGPLAGKTLVATHIDSWEVGSQNWTRRFREEFQRLRGYDPLMFLPVATGRVVDGLEISERFLWDLRMTIAELLMDNYAGHFRELARRHGLRLSIEAYGNGPYDNLVFAGRADEPMAEFWAWSKFGAAASCTEMASAAHVYGKRILGAEAFTATDQEKWLGHPAAIKDIGDWAFCEGINRFVFHRYALQPWADRRPGMSMGPWGLHYERSQTWWEQSSAWHEYLSRCQYLLQQGLFVADICCLTPENAPQRFTPPPGVMPDERVRPGYNFDGCPPEVVMTRMRVRDERLVLPDGMSYRLLVLPAVKTMTPALLRRIKELVADGATVLGERPVKSPSLVNYPRCDAEVKQLADELWGDCDGKTVIKHQHGKGWVFQGQTPEQVLGWMGAQPDFTSQNGLRYIHRTLGEAEVYFVANPHAREVADTCKFNVSGKPPEFWRPDTGRIETAALFEADHCCTRVPLRLEPRGSVFVVFRPVATKLEPVTALTRDGQSLLALAMPAQPARIVIHKAAYGVLDDPARTRDVRAKVQALADAGTLNFRVAEMAKGDDPAYGTVKTLVIDYSVNGQNQTASGQDRDIVGLSIASAAPLVATVGREGNRPLRIEAWENGRYEIKLASGALRQIEVSEIPGARRIEGPWEVRFTPGWGAPEKIVLEKLIAWDQHRDPGVRYYSGTAIYRGAFLYEPPSKPDPLGTKHYLDLGQVEVMAEVKLNGQDYGTLWKPPFRADITAALKPGRNELEIKVVNLWINRMIGDEQLPEDSARNANGTLKEWPQWLQAGTPGPGGRFTFTSWRLWKKQDKLVPSGLLGPVTLRATRVADLGDQ